MKKEIQSKRRIGIDLFDLKENLENFMIYEIENNRRSLRSSSCCDNDTCEDECRKILYRINRIINEIDKKASEEDYE